MAGNPPPLTPDQIAETRRLDDEQVESAQRWLSGDNPAVREQGAQQLAAYPTPKAERLLTAILSRDPAPRVRAAAAQSLDAFAEPTMATVSVLLAALADESNDVRRNVWFVLQGIISNGEEDSARTREIVARLKACAVSARIPQDLRDEIREFLANQSLPP